MKTIINKGWLLTAGVLILPGCVIAPPESGPQPYYTQPYANYSAPMEYDGMVQATYTPQPMDVVIVDLAPENFIYVGGWTYIHHRDPYGNWVNERYRQGDARAELREHQAMLHEVRARNGGQMPDHPMTINMKPADANRWHLHAQGGNNPQQEQQHPQYQQHPSQSPYQQQPGQPQEQYQQQHQAGQPQGQYQQHQAGQPQGQYQQQHQAGQPQGQYQQQHQSGQPQDQYQQQHQAGQPQYQQQQHQPGQAQNDRQQQQNNRRPDQKPKKKPQQQQQQQQQPNNQ